MLTEELRLEKTEIVIAGDAAINLRFVHVVLRDGIEISQQYVRKSITRGDNLDGLPPWTQAVAHTLWREIPPPAPVEDPITEPAAVEEVMP